MIARVWSATTPSDRLTTYLDHLRRQVLPILRGIEGFEDVTVLQRQHGDGFEVIVITYWRSVDAVRAFAGADVEHAVVAEEAAALLTSYDERVGHYDVALRGALSSDERA